jgi:hypothetical protein
VLAPIDLPVAEAPTQYSPTDWQHIYLFGIMEVATHLTQPVVRAPTLSDSITRQQWGMVLPVSHRASRSVNY